MLKGKTTIELTNVNTGEVEVYEDENMITNAVSDIMTYNPLGFRYRNYYNDSKYYTDIYTELQNSFAYTLTPIIPNLIGGITLLENTLVEDPNQYYVPDSNPIVGYSSNDVNTNANPKRGSMNQSESKRFTDDNGNQGYRFVFDFSTSQGNGIISALGLTSKKGGVAMYGDNYESIYSILCVDKFQVSSGESITTGRNQYAKRIMNIISIDLENNYGIYAFVKGLNTIEIGKIYIPFNKLNLFNKYTNTTNFTVLESKDLTTSTFASNHTNIGSSSSTYYDSYSTLIDDNNGFIWGFQHKNNLQGNSSGDANILWIKINKKDWSFEEGEWILPNVQLNRFGIQYYPGNSISYYQANENCLIIKDNVLYALSNNGYGVYKIPLDDPTNFSLLESSFKITNIVSHHDNNYYWYNTTIVNNIGERICYPNAIIENNKIINKVYKTANYNNSYPSVRGLSAFNAKPAMKCGPYLIGFGGTTENNQTILYATVWLPMMYLATINNLISPIEKTADKTMKITYTLTEIAD